MTCSSTCFWGSRWRIGETERRPSGEGERGLALAIATQDHFGRIPYGHHPLARIYLACGDYDKALDQIQILLDSPYFISRAWLEVDPTWAPLKGNPRFERIIATQTAPVA